MKPGMILYREELGLLLFMNDFEIAEAMRLLARRFLFDEEPETDDLRVDTFLQIAIPKQELDEQKYEKRIANSSKGGSTTQANNKCTSSTLEVNDKCTSSKNQVSLNEHEHEHEHEHELEHEPKQERGKTRTRAFTPPTIEEIAEYCQTRGNGISAERFFDHYSANGWKVGKSPMKDWKAAVRNWEKNEFREKKTEIASHGWDYDQLAEAAYRKAMR